LTVFTTRPDTIMGVTYLAVAAEHPLAIEAAADNKVIAAFLAECRQVHVAEAALETAEKRGMALGIDVIHPVSGEKVLSNFSYLKEILPMVRHHHEAFDGSGYPDGIDGENIPLGSRIIGLFNRFDNLVCPHANGGQRHGMLGGFFQPLSGKRMADSLVTFFVWECAGSGEWCGRSVTRQRKDRYSSCGPRWRWSHGGYWVRVFVRDVRT